MRFDRSFVSWLGLPLGPVLAVLAWAALPAAFVDPAGDTVPFTAAGRATAAVGVWMAVWWMTEAIPVYATALLPLAIFPPLGIAGIGAAAAPYGHETIFLFLGGFVLALSMERWGLHTRIALFALRMAGTRAAGIIAVFMLVTAVLSMWVSNTATTIIMLPIAVSVIGLLREKAAGMHGDDQRHFALALMLGIAWAASIGGLGTLIGTPPNLFLASYAERQMGIRIGFAQWMLYGIPLVAVLLPLAWGLLTRFLFPLHALRIPLEPAFARAMYAGLGSPNRGERVTFFVFVLTALAWILRPLLNRWPPLGGLDDTGIAVSAALLLFLIPVDARARTFTMDWSTAVRLPWGILLLFGGGLSLAAAVRANGVAEYLGAQVGGLSGLPPLVILAALVLFVIFLTELTSNTATTAALLPIVAAIAPTLGLQPLLAMTAVAVSASCAFMLPVATPPNAIVYGSGHVPGEAMARAGFWLNLMATAAVTVMSVLLVERILGG